MHDLLLSRSGIAAPASHPLRVAVTRHKARLGAELSKIRIKEGFRSLDELRSHVARSKAFQAQENLREELTSAPKDGQWPHPRWARVNTLKTTLEAQLRTTFADYKATSSLEEILRANSSSKILHIDEHVPDLLALPAGTDLTATAAYRNGLIILQDKASCFPAYLIDPYPEHGASLDACAAPGNKTTHLAAILQSRCQDGRQARIWACERDKARAETLTKMVSLAGCQDSVTVRAGQDFLLLDPVRAPWKDVGSLLLDPSCSGSGIVGRDETLAVTLPANGGNFAASPMSRKRKRGKKIDAKPTSTETLNEQHLQEEEPSDVHDRDEDLSARLKSLSAFQLRLLLHAFQFASAQRITYSTCSIHAEENEGVVVEALRSPTAKECGWRLLRRDEQVAGMQSWSMRGDVVARHGTTEGCSTTAEEVAEGCIRSRAGTEEGTQGFFVAAFVRDLGLSSQGSTTKCVSPCQADEPSGSNGGMRDSTNANVVESGEEWEGLSDMD